jgi:hypothetical protein
MSGYLQGKEMGGAPQAPAPAKAVMSKAVTIPALNALRAAGEKIAMLTCYDASFASLMDRCGVEVLLIGDSLGMVCNGHTSTLPVTVAGSRLPHRLGGARHQVRDDRGRYALRQLRHAGSGVQQRRAADAGWRAHGQDRRRCVAGRHRALPDRPRGSGLRPPRPDAAIGAHPGRLQFRIFVKRMQRLVAPIAPTACSRRRAR